MTRIVRFTQAEIVRAIKGFQNAGIEVGAIRFDADGTMAILAGGYEKSGAEEDDWRDGSPLYAARETEPNAYSVRTLADRWGCSEQLIRNMIKRGQLRSFRHGNLIRIKPDAVAEVEARRDR